MISTLSNTLSPTTLQVLFGLGLLVAVLAFFWPWIKPKK